MNEDENSYIGFGFFFLFILGIVCFGSFLLYKNHTKKIQNAVTFTNNEVKINDEKKKDKEKDFIYYQEEVTVSKTLALVYKYPIINLDSNDATMITQSLKKLVDEKKNKIEKTKDSLVNSICNDTTDGIKNAPILDFAIYSYLEYTTLVLYESNYSCETGISAIQSMKSYTFNVLTGEYLTFSDLLTKYNTSFSNGVSLMQEVLHNNQVTLNGIENIKVKETISNLKENDTYIFYIDELGELVMKYIVKTNTVDYNDTISLK